MREVPRGCWAFVDPAGYAAVGVVGDRARVCLWVALFLFGRQGRRRRGHGFSVPKLKLSCRDGCAIRIRASELEA